MTPRALVILRISIKLKQKLNDLRHEGRTINGYITHLLEREFTQAEQQAATRGQKGR